MKVVITIEDIGDSDGVRVTAEPKFAEIMVLAKAGKLTSAHGYAVAALNKIRDEARNQKKGKIIVPVPKIYGRG